jgi:hypothetical protein
VWGRVERRVLIGIVATAIALVLALDASAAAPRYIMITGPGLPQPVLIDDWWENLDVMRATSYGTSVSSARLARRPRFLVSLFWNANAWPEPPTTPSGANQRGWFYPAYGARPAVWRLERSFNWIGVQRRATSELLTILARHGVPTRCSVKPRNLRACL